MKSNVFIIVGLCLIVAACKKREYPDDKVKLDEEDVYVNGYIDNEPIHLKIGTDGYYCYSSYEQQSDSVYVFKGELKKFDCRPCPAALRIELSDYRLRLPGAPVNVDSSLRIGSRHFIPGMPKTKTIKFTSHSNKEVSALRWELGNGVSSQNSIFSYEFSQPGPQTVSLTVKTKGNCESVVVNKVYFGGESGVFACDITAEPLQNNSSRFKTNIIGGKAPFRYVWNFGDGGTSTLAVPDHDYQWTGSYPVKLQIIDAENHVCESNYIHVTANDKSSCATNVTLSYEGTRNVSFNGVKIQWSDPANLVLRSDSISQPTESYFEILNSQAYEPNEKGEAGRLLTLRFNVMLQGGNRKIRFKSESAAIIVAYK